MARRGDDFERGRKVGKYELVTRLSVGGMAELYLAFLPGPGGFKKFVALKMILPDIRRDEAFIKMFLDEARLTAALNHPNLGQVYELGHVPDTGELYLAMEYLAGTTLAAVQRAEAHRQPLPWGFSCRVVRDVCLGLHSAHTFVDAHGKPRLIVHRDVSPSNVMVTWDGRVKVIDFGVARARGRLVRTQAGMVKGTVGYMSPEQALDEPLDARSDVFSAGMVLYELLSGAPPFANLNGTKLLETLATCDVPHLSEVASAVPRVLADAVMTALVRDVSRRCPSARELARRIEAAHPKLFDEEQLAAQLQALFPDGVALSRQLLESASAEDAAAHAVDEVVAKLQEVTAPTGRALEQRAAPEVPPEAPAEAKGRAAVLVGAGLVVALLLGGGYFVATFEAGEVAEEDSALAQLEAQVVPQVHMALAARDVTRARQLLDSCSVRGKPCPAALALLPEVEAEEAKRAEALTRAEKEKEAALPPKASTGPCDLGPAHAALREADFDRATSLLRACTTATGLDPRAEKLLTELGKSQMTRNSVTRAKQALDAGDLKEAKSVLVSVPSKGVWKDVKAALEQRLRALANERGLVGSKGKVLEVGRPVPPEEPRPVKATPEHSFLSAAEERLSRGDLPGAAQLLRTCTTSLPKNPECEYRLAGVLARSGDPGGAFRAYKRFLELARPGDARLPKVRQLVQDYERAR
ncbi:MAG: serine/threonine protein kinase [Myxococcales bacterium]|nr:serine/threonine protein kinase [Myxococcales bacterium]